MTTFSIDSDSKKIVKQLKANFENAQDHTCGYITLKLPENVAEGKVYVQLFATGSYHIHINAQFNENVRFDFVTDAPSRPHSLCVLDGACELDMSGSKYDSPVSIHCSTLFRCKNHTGFSINVSADQPVCFSLIHFGEALVDELVQPYCETDVAFLLPSSTTRADRTFCLGPVASFATSRLIADAFATALRGVARTAYVYGKTMEAVAVQLDLAERLSRGETFAKPLPPEDVRLLEAANQFIRVKYPEDITIADIARHVGTNQQKLKKIFKVFFGTTISKYLRRVRIENGKNLLRTGRFSVGDAANAVGYANQSHFAVRFKEEIGVSPSEFLRVESFIAD